MTLCAHSSPRCRSQISLLAALFCPPPDACVRARGGCGHAVPLSLGRTVACALNSARELSSAPSVCSTCESCVLYFSMRQTRIRYANYLRGLNKRHGKVLLALRCALKVLITFSSVGALALRAPVRARRARQLARGGERQPLARHRLDDQLEEVLLLAFRQ